MKIRLWLLLALSLHLPARAEPPALERDPHYTALFDRKEGWLGADGAFSALLGGKRILWLFSDTLVGKPGHVTMPHNSLAIEENRSIHFYPQQIFTPPDGKGWFWVYQALPSTESPLECWVFLGQFDETPGPEGFNFKLVGSWLARLRVPPGGTPQVLEYQALPHWNGFGEGKADIHFGTALVARGEYLYIYGTADRGGFDKQLLLARAPIPYWRQSSTWTYYAGFPLEGDRRGCNTGFPLEGDRRGCRWVGSCDQARPLKEESGLLQVSNELSVFPQGNQLCLLTQQGYDVALYDSSQPWGPFKLTRKLGPIVEKGTGFLTYNAKAHPHLRDARGRMLITYNRNAIPVKLVNDDPSIYRPQFFRLNPR